MRKLILAIALLPMAGATASAQEYSVATIQNQTQDTITFTVFFAAAPPRVITLFPNQTDSIWSRNDPTGIFQVEFDPVVNCPRPRERISIQTYRSAVPNAGGKPYAFSQSPGDQVVFLIAL